MNFTLGDLASRLDGELRGDANIVITGVATLSNAQPGQISFLANSKYQQQLSTTSASAVLVRASDAEVCPVDCIVVPDPYLAFAKTVEILNPVTKHPAGIHASAVIAEGCTIDDSAWIGPNCVVEAGSVISSGVQLSAGCVIGANCTISRDSTLKANVTVYHGCVIGERAIIHSGAVIGSDGFGFANDKGRWHKIQQIGRVVIGNDVEIGANTTIDRGAIEDTVIEDGVKLDNLIQIAHNVRIGAHTAMAGHSAVAGSTVIGSHCAIGGAVGIVGHLKICDNVTVTAMSLVSKSITEAGVYSSGMPVEANPEWNKRVARIRQLDELTKRVRQLEQQITK